MPRKTRRRSKSKSIAIKSNPTTITETAKLEQYCELARRFQYVAIDTEFMRESKYYSTLCLIQMAIPSSEKDSEVLVDALSPKLKLNCLRDLFSDSSVVKVFHSARQDLEIFHLLGLPFPKPLFDTQIAAMACGFGEQPAYSTLVRRLLQISIAKSARFTDWSKRPLSDAQKEYAISDVTHLRKVYELLRARLDQKNRGEWIEDEFVKQLDKSNYEIDLENIWRRIKTSTNDRTELAILREVAKYRELRAQAANVPRHFILSDNAILELAGSKPNDVKALKNLRFFKGSRKIEKFGHGIIAAIEKGMKCGPEDRPQLPPEKPVAKNKCLVEILRLLLKIKAEKSGVAGGLIASARDLNQMAMGNWDLQTTNGWRNQLFGADAVRLCKGEIALTVQNSRFIIVDLQDRPTSSL